MIEIVNIAHPFQTVEEFQQLVGKHLSELIHRLAGKYPRLLASCGMKRVLLAVSVAWGLSGMAKAGCVDAFAHIDDALQPPMSLGGCVKAPPGGLVMVKGQPFFICEGEQGMLRFLWDGFAIFIDHEGCERVRQEFFDLADLRQSKAYAVMGECQENHLQEEKQVRIPESTDHQEPSDGNQESGHQVRENQEPCQAKQSTANSEKAILFKPNYSETNPSTVNCSETNAFTVNCSETNASTVNCSETNASTFKTMIGWGIEYACDIDRVKTEEVEPLKDFLESYLDSPMAEMLSSDDILLIAKRIRGIKPCRAQRLRARAEEAERQCMEAEQRRLETERQCMEMKAKLSAGSPVTNNFYGRIEQWIASVGMVSSDK